MINRITNWTIGSFFRTIGRIVAYFIIGLLIYLFASGNVKAYSIKRNYKSFSDIITSTNNNWSSCSLSGDSSIITLSDTNNYLKSYYFIFKDDYNNNLSDNNFKVFTNDTSFYVVINRAAVTSNSYFINAYKNKTEISEDVYNEYSTDPLQKYRIYHDTTNNKYYWFNNYVDQYLVSNVSSSLINTDRYATYLFSTNIDDLYFVSNSNVDVLKKTNNVCYSNKNDIISHNVSFNLNGGKSCLSSSGGSSGSGNTGTGCHYENYIQRFYDKNSLYAYIQSLTVTKTGMTFIGWYSDINLINLYDFGNDLLTDVTLYAKFVFTDVNTLVNNVNFRTYTFPEDKDYAIISNSSLNDVYIGFQYDFNNINVFQYDKDQNNFIIRPNYTLGSIGNVDGWYYYMSPLTSYETEIEYIILDKKQLKVLANGTQYQFESFKVSDNGTVTFYSDLNSISLTDSDNNTYTGNASTVYYNYLNTVISNNSDIITIFRQIANNRDRTVFGTFGSIWNKFKATPIFNYFYLIIIGSFIIFIIKVASRK